MPDPSGAGTNAAERSGICAMAVMAKAPQPGRSKTRLVPPLTAEGAAAISAAFLRDVTENVRGAAAAAAIDGYIAYAPAGLEHLFDGMLAEGTGLVLADGGLELPTGVDGFGRALLHAVRSLIGRGYGAACVLNSDSPTLPTALLRETALALAAPGDRAVLGPAEDGGYYLLGVKSPRPDLFRDIEWSTGAVAEQTRERARAIGLELIELEPWYDVDDRTALHRLMRELDAAALPDAGVSGITPYRAPATAACVELLGVRAMLAGVA